MSEEEAAAAGAKVSFGVTSKGKLSVIHKQYEFVEHRKYASGNVQWRCKHYQSAKCQARLTTKNDDVVSKTEPVHNHSSTKQDILARQAVIEMKDKMFDLSATPSAVIASVVNQLEPDVIMALPGKQTLKRALNRKRQKLQSYWEANMPPLTTDMTFGTFPVPPDQFQEDLTDKHFDSGSGNDRLGLGERAKKKWENIYNAYSNSRTNPSKFSKLLSFLETVDTKPSSSLNESGATSLDNSEHPLLAEQASTPKSKKRKRDVDLCKTEETEWNQTNISPDSPINNTFCATGPSDIDSFCQLIAVRMKSLPEEERKKTKKEILEILHKSEVQSLLV